jgi:hypothetical protein
LTTGAGFSPKYQWQSSPGTNRGHVLSICGVCGRGLITHVRAVGWSSFPNMSEQAHTVGSARFEITETWPRTNIDVPSDVPENIARFYYQGLKALKAQHWDAAGAMFRKTLDVATKHLRPDLGKNSLYDRIESMVKGGDLTSAMGEWSHRIRLDGNDAIHGEEPETEDDANASQRFAEAFLTYSYSLPSLVRGGQRTDAN